MVYSKKRTILIVLLALLIAIGKQTETVAALDAFFCETNPVLYSCTSTCSSSGTDSASGKSIDVTTGDGGGCGSDDLNANKQQIWSFLKGKGLSDEAAAGIMGNMDQESSFNPKATNGIGCRGVVQWCFGRNDTLNTFAADRGKDWSCLGVQLEYMWSEMGQPQGSTNSQGERLEIPMADALNGKPFSNSGNYTDSAPFNAARIFHDYFERANVAKGEDKGRGERAEKIYQEFTGKAATPLGNSSSSGGSGGSCKGATTNGGPIPSANCKEVQDSFNSLKSSGKITLEIPQIDDDVSKCSEQKLQECTKGARVQTIRGIDAIAQNSGVDTIRLWNINDQHDCDGMDHPKGLASDIKQANGTECSSSNPDDCKKVFDYVISHADELGVKYVIWDGSYCTQQQASNSGVEIYCNGEHNNHIHVSFKDS